MLIKSSDQSTAFVGETVTYEVRLENPCCFALTDIVFTDVLPQGLAFVPGSVTINNTPAPQADPELGFALPDLLGRNEVIVRFEADVVSNQSMTVINTAQVEYQYTPVVGGIVETFVIESNEVSLDIIEGEEEVVLLMSKIGIAAPLTGGEFTFGLFEQGSQSPLETATNNANGLVTFAPLHFTHIGEFRYTIREISAPPGWEVDVTEWPVTINVTNVQGVLTAVVTYPNGVPVFVNKKTSDTCGLFQFPDLTFDAPGVYEFTLRELTPSGGGWITDDRVIRLVVTVVDDGHGNLIATIEYPDGFPSFTNTYHTAPTRIIISGCKIAIGAPLPAGKFEFGLFNSEGELIAKVTNGPADETDPDDTDDDDQDNE
jgi:uncharacterized repeat protein (TIGR01451 family)/pilin isopeptide linkage protein